MWDYLVEKVRKQKPLIHCITNYVTARDMANMVLAAGGSPVMADEYHEVREVAGLSQGLVLNLGTAQPRRVSAMVRAGRAANSEDKPVVFDPVGVGSSRYRTRAALRVMRRVRCSVIRGNASEIHTLADMLDSRFSSFPFWGRSGAKSGTQGVDAGERDRVTEQGIQDAARFARDFSRKTGAVVVMTGAVDIVASERQVFIIRNGNAMMARVTGAGCMLDGVVAAYCAVSPGNHLHACAAAVSMMGLCGEKAYEKVRMMHEGNASFCNYMVDFMSILMDGDLKEGANVEIF